MVYYRIKPRPVIPHPDTASQALLNRRTVIARRAKARRGNLTSVLSYHNSFPSVPAPSIRCVATPTPNQLCHPEASINSNSNNLGCAGSHRKLFPTPYALLKPKTPPTKKTLMCI